MDSFAACALPRNSENDCALLGAGEAVCFGKVAAGGGELEIGSALIITRAAMPPATWCAFIPPSGMTRFQRFTEPGAVNKWAASSRSRQDLDDKTGFSDLFGHI
jgi:hypothetical protein